MTKQARHVILYGLLTRDRTDVICPLQAVNEEFWIAHAVDQCYAELREHQYARWLALYNEVYQWMYGRDME